MSVAEIIDGLTAPQRRALLSGRRRGTVDCVNWPLSSALQDKLLVRGGGRTGLRLTDLGAAVAAELDKAVAQ